jgi:hypothetical protein
VLRLKALTFLFVRNISTEADMRISEKTTVPLFAVLLTLPTFVGGILWLTAISFKADTAIAANAKQDETLDEQAKTLKNIERLVIRIDEKLNNQGRR